MFRLGSGLVQVKLGFGSLRGTMFGSSVTRYYDKELLAWLGMLDNIRLLFARGGMGHFLEIKKHTYQALTLEFLSTFHIKVTRRPQGQAEYISFYL